MWNYIIKNIFLVSLKDERKIAELKIAAFIGEHCSINAVDHLGVLIKSLDPKSQTLCDLKLHRTKCTSLILNVLAPCWFNELIKDIGSMYYSLIIDESTSHDKKMLCLMIKYFSKKKANIVTTFYRLVEIEKCDAQSLFNCVVETLKKDDLDVNKLLGIGVDGASVMVGRHNSLSSKLKEVVPHLIVNRCICHSLHLACEKAFSVLPSFLDFLIRETYNWFSYSSKRQAAYNNLYQELKGGIPNKISKLSGTRWLARSAAINTILNQWDLLKVHFNTISNNASEKCYVSHSLRDMYKKNEAFIYFHFLKNTLSKVVYLNKLFQSNDMDPLKLLNDLNDLLYSLLNIIVVPNQLNKVSRSNLVSYDFEQYTMGSTCINYGYYFTKHSSLISSEHLLEVQNRCKQFMIILCKEIQKRIPDNLNILERINVFSPDQSTSILKSDITNIVVEFNALVENVDCTLKEWNLLNSLDSEDVKQLNSTVEFWAYVSKIKDAGGQPKFGNISSLVLNLLCLPISNATVERAFSIMNIVRDKLRNRLATLTAEAIMRLRYSLNGNCDTFSPTPEMLKLFNSEVMYSNNFDDSVLDYFNTSNSENNFI